ncbi:uncharacterized protein LOC101757545 [Setaria italica]|uniref:uncharacterized protein LOC101757545 n=1 Tax=Setaria italica TaxID=4555 RepID=UPI000BE50901|nr:uncharacterized protein LOC101757545 [Setaria italica]
MLIVSYDKLQDLLQRNIPARLRKVALYGPIVVALLGLVGAYAFGSCRDSRHVFFYFNSAAFVASLVITVMLQSERLVRRHALEAAMILDLFGLIGAYAAGSARDTTTSIYTVAMAGVVLIYVVIHIVFFTLDSTPPAGSSTTTNEEGGSWLKKKRDVLLLLSVLGATLAYQAGLTPPGGFWEEDDKSGHHRAGFPVLLDKYPIRYKIFYYFNAASFMASVALIVLLLNPNLYKPGIECYALYVCMVAGMLGLMGAYSAGSSMHLRTSIVVLALASALTIASFAVAIYVRCIRSKGEAKKKEQDNKEKKNGQEDTMIMFLMLVGILGASVTYLTGLKPPCGMWRDDANGHSAAGYPVLYDTNKRRYNVFFYNNSTSFMASIAIIASRCLHG